MGNRVRIEDRVGEGGIVEFCNERGSWMVSRWKALWRRPACGVLGRAGVRNDNRSQREAGSSKKERRIEVTRKRGEMKDDGDFGEGFAGRRKIMGSHPIASKIASGHASSGGCRHYISTARQMQTTLDF